jgi:uncharacterized RDD family membrane protein YckC
VLLSKRSTGTSAAQNGPVIRICPKCGALLLDNNEQCSICEIPPELSDGIAAPAAPSWENDVAVEPEWRREVSRRLGEYRARRNRPDPDNTQSGLPFHQEVALEPEDAPKRSRLRAVPRSRRTERVEICIQPELDFSSAPTDRARPQCPLVPVAGLAQRRWAAALDATFLGLTCAGFAVLFRSLGGEITLAKMDALVCLAVLCLFYGLYFFLFTMLAGATLGMQLCGLTIVRLDGTLPDSRQLLWRSFGYLLSAATLMLGFFWALWDEDRFTWQDRISQTYVTAAAPVVSPDPIELQPGDLHSQRHRFAHR